MPSKKSATTQPGPYEMPNGWMLFRSAHSKGQVPGQNGVDISRTASKIWRSMSKEQQDAWKDKSKELKEEQKVKYPDFKAKRNRLLGSGSKEKKALREKEGNASKRMKNNHKNAQGEGSVVGYASPALASTSMASGSSTSPVRGVEHDVQGFPLVPTAGGQQIGLPAFTFTSALGYPATMPLPTAGMQPLQAPHVLFPPPPCPPTYTPYLMPFAPNPQYSQYPQFVQPNFRTMALPPALYPGGDQISTTPWQYYQTQAIGAFPSSSVETPSQPSSSASHSPNPQASSRESSDSFYNDKELDDELFTCAFGDDFEEDSLRESNQLETGKKYG